MNELLDNVARSPTENVGVVAKLVVANATLTVLSSFARAVELIVPAVVPTVPATLACPTDGESMVATKPDGQLLDASVSVVMS